MANKFNFDALDDVDKLFKERSVDEIIKIEKSLDVEIENKRVDLRSMVGDRYKDVLTASDAIKSMKSLSETIVENIQLINDRCERLIVEASIDHSKQTAASKNSKHEDFVFGVQVMLTMNINEQIWIALDKEDYSKAAQLYLLGQHIHTGLRLLKEDVLGRLPILRRIKASIESLRSRILGKINEKLQCVEISAQETSSNLTALMLLENNTSSELLKFFMESRKIALISVIESNHRSVRVQISAMVRCLITTVHLLHDCFLCYGDQNTGLIWQELEAIVAENAPRTLAKIHLPKSPLVHYISDIIRQFRPKCANAHSELSSENIKNVVAEWLKSTSEIVRKGLQKSLELVTTVKGLHTIREEALKTDVPPDWNTICTKANLPPSFEIWYYFFQELVSNRVQYLITKKNSNIINELQQEIADGLLNSTKNNKSDNSLRMYCWLEDINDVSRTENKHLGLSMKTKGFSPTIVELCQKVDTKYFEVLQDLSHYLYGKEFGEDFNVNFILKDRVDRKFIDRDKMEQCLIKECKGSSEKFAKFLVDLVEKKRDTGFYISGSLDCARFLMALSSLCPYYRRCCSCNGSSEEWDEICSIYNRYSLEFWQHWVDYSVSETKNSSQEFSSIDSLKLLHILPKWDTIEIQEQTEERVFRSQIKVPCQCSLVLQDVLKKLNDNVNTILPYTMPKQIHLKFIEKNVEEIFRSYERLTEADMNQTQALQFLFDVKFITMLAIPRENIQLIQKSQELCDRFRSKVDPFDLDVFYSYLQNNVKQSVLQSQVILGCLLPSSSQLSSLGMLEKNKEHEKDPSILALSIPSNTTWFPLLPVTAPAQKILSATPVTPKEINKASTAVSAKSSGKKSARSGAASLFGAMATDWFS